jgi:hypothetical protein
MLIFDCFMTNSYVGRLTMRQFGLTTSGMFSETYTTTRKLIGHTIDNTNR